MTEQLASLFGEESARDSRRGAAARRMSRQPTARRPVRLVLAACAALVLASLAFLVDSAVLGAERRRHRRRGAADHRVPDRQLDSGSSARSNSSAAWK